MGDSVGAPSARVDYRLRVRVPKTRSFIRLFRDGKTVAVSRGGSLDFVTQEPGAYRVEAFLYKYRLGNICLNAKPWIFSNPIYIQPAGVDADVSVRRSAEQGRPV